MFSPLFASQSYIGKSTLLLDLQADTGVTVSDTDKVDVWADQSGNGFNFTQTGTARPTLTTVGGYPCLQFDGVNDWMLGQNWSALDNMDSFTIFSITDIASGIVGAITKIGNDCCSDPGANGWDMWESGAMSLSSDSNNFIFQDIAPIPDGKILCSTDIISRTEMHTYLNGAPADIEPNGGQVHGTGAGNYSNSEPVRIGIDGAAGACDSYTVGDIYTIRIYSPVLSAAQRAAVEQELAARYGVTL